MLNRLKPKSEFSRNVLTLMTGTTIAQAIPIAISPILTRIYSPEDFGIFALYMSVASILSVVATGRYELAIMLPKKDEDAVNIVALSILISFFVSFITLLIVFMFNAQITNLLGNPEISSWLYFIPITVLLTGVYQSFNYWSNRKKQYKRLATSRVIQSGTTATTNLGMGFGGFGSTGLILSGVLGQGVATAVFCKMVWKEDKRRLKEVKRLKIFALSRQYIKFPTINLFHAFFNTLSTNLPVLIIQYYFTNSIVGFYAFGNKIITLPIGLITGSYGQIFFQKLSSSDKIDRKNLFNKTLKQLLLYSAIPFILLFIIAPYLFSFIFGDEWYIAGVYTQILIPMLYFRFTGSIVSSVVLIYNKQEKAFFLEIINTILRIISLLIGGVFQDVILGLILFSCLSSIVTVYRLFWYKQCVNKGIKK